MDKPWLKSYPEDVPAEIPTPEFMSVRDMIESCFQDYADRTAYSNMGTRLTFRDLDNLSAKFACYL